MAKEKRASARVDTRLLELPTRDFRVLRRSLQEQLSHHTKSYEAEHTITHTFQPPGNGVLPTKGERSSLLARFVKGREGHCRQVFCVRRLPIKKPKATYATQKVPDRPWSRLSADIFTLKGKQYISLVDHYSDFIEVGELVDTTSETVLQFLKEQFSRYGIPDCVVTDNASQLVSHEFHNFSVDWESEHVTSSPLYPKSNGKAESSVKVAKKLFKKALKDGKDPWLALLDQRNTPTEGLGCSPAQRLMSRRTRGLLHTAKTLLKPKVEGVKDKIKLRKQKSKLKHDRTAKLLPELEIGQDVTVPPTSKHQLWKTGKCVETLSDRSYLVSVGKETLRRNRQFLTPMLNHVSGKTMCSRSKNCEY